MFGYELQEVKWNYTSSTRFKFSHLSLRIPA